MRRRAWMLNLAWLVASTLANPSVAGVEGLCGRPLQLAYSMLPPLYYLEDSSKQGQGIEVDIAAELARRTGCRLDPSYESRIRVWAAFEAEQIDLSLSGVATPERERFGVFLPYLKFRNVLLVRDDTAPRDATAAANPMTDPATTVVVTRGFRYGPKWDAWIRQQEERGLVSYVAEEGDAVRLVAIGRATATIVRDIAWSYYDKRHTGAQRLRRIDVGAAENALSVVLSRKTLSAEQQKALARTLADMKADGTLRRILGRHVGAEQAERLMID
ncbi:transporter substrate-binding domain-containing protein [Niveibacterium umoris]|uniref:transporter substrate-binding domain-containing protein n=1 Tax=Niveibacterium umoris TaxID=1193620 RepID=UPI00160FA057